MRSAAMLLPVLIAASVNHLVMAALSGDAVAMPPSWTAPIVGTTTGYKSATFVDVGDVPSITSRRRPEVYCDNRYTTAAAAAVYVVSRSTKYKLNVEERLGNLREVHVQQNLQGTVEIQDGDVDSHVIEIELNTAADTSELLDEIIITKEFTDRGQHQLSNLILSVGLKPRTSGALTGLILTGSVLCISVLLVVLSIVVIVRRHRHRHAPGRSHVIDQLSGRRVSTLSATNCYSDLEQPNVIWKNTFMDSPTVTSFDDKNVTQVVHRPLDPASSSVYGSSRTPMTSLLTVAVFALATSVGVTSLCVQLIEANVTIRIPRSLKLEAVRVFFNGTTNSFESSRWSQQNSSQVYVNGEVRSEWNPLADGKLLRREIDAERIALDDVIPSGCIHSFVCSRSRRPSDSTPAEGEERCPLDITVEKSSNLFIDDLSTARSLETTFYVTDSKQQTDFFWYRPSGLRVNVGLQDIAIVPVYEEVDHGGGDTNFVLGSPAVRAEREQFKSIHRQHCRNPIPDYYSVTLEVLKDRATRATSRPCSEMDYSIGRCGDGELSFVDRTINEPCHKMGSYPEPLMAAENSIICTDANQSMLTKLFNITSSIVRPISFPSDMCKSARSRCDQCLANARCGFNDLFERMCCQLNCQSLQDCKMASSDVCKQRPIECALGDSYRYTLTPVFNDISKTFRCHVTRRIPSVLYRLWFYVTVPGGFLETQRIFVDVTPSTGGGAGSPLSPPPSSHSGRFTFDEFLTVEFDTRRRFADDVILTGVQTSGAGEDVAGSGSEWVHAISDVIDYVRLSQDATAVDNKVHRLSDNGYVTSVVFDEPFAYSTSNWVKDNPCSKNVTKFRQITQPLSSSNDRYAALPVNVITNNDPNGPYRYLLKMADDPPQMKIALPGSASLLRWWFRDKNVTLIKDNSLRVHVTSNDTHGLLHIYIEGHVTDCPAYLAVTINTWPPTSSSRTLVKYDVLVSCPPHLYLTLTLPSSTRPSSGDRDDVDDGQLFSDCALELVFDDLTTTHRVIAVVETHPPTTVSDDPPTSRSKSARTVLPVVESQDTNRHDDVAESDGRHMIAVVTFIAVALVMTSLITCIERSMTCRGSRNGGKVPCVVSVGEQNRTKLKQKHRRRRHQQPDRKSGSMTTSVRHGVARIACISLKIACSFLFTFTVFFTIVDAGLRRNIDDIFVDIARTHNRKSSDGLRRRDVAQMFFGDGVEVSSTSDELLKLTQSQPPASDDCFDQLIATSVDEFAAKFRRRSSGDDVFHDEFKRKMNRQRMTAREIYKRTTEVLLSKIRTITSAHSRNLSVTFRTNWLLYPASLFNKTDQELARQVATSIEGGRHQPESSDSNANFVIGFGRFIDVFAPETVRLLTTAVRQRSSNITTMLLQQLPSAPSIAQRCDNSTSADLLRPSLSLDVQTHWHQLDSSRFFTSHPTVHDVSDSSSSGFTPPRNSPLSPPDTQSRRSSLPSGGGADNAGVVPTADYVTRHMNALSADIRLDIVRIVFTILDVAVVLRRCSLLVTLADRAHPGRRMYSPTGRLGALHLSSTEGSRDECNGHGTTAASSGVVCKSSDTVIHRQGNGCRIPDTDSGGETAWDCHTDRSVRTERPSVTKRWSAVFDCPTSRFRHHGCWSSRWLGYRVSSSDDCSTSTRQQTNGASAGLLQRFYLCLTVLFELFIVVQSIDFVLYSFARKCCHTATEQGIESVLQAVRKIDEVISVDVAASQHRLRMAKLTNYVFLMTSLESQVISSVDSDERAAWWNSTETQSRCLFDNPTFKSHQPVMETSTLVDFSVNTHHSSTIRFARQLTIAVWNCILIAVVGVFLFELLDRLLSIVVACCTNSVGHDETDYDDVIDLMLISSKPVDTTSASNGIVSSLSQRSRDFRFVAAPPSPSFSTSPVVEEPSTGNRNTTSEVMSTDPPMNCLKVPSGHNKDRRCPTESETFGLQRHRVRFATAVGAVSRRPYALTMMTSSAQQQSVNYLDMDSIESNV